MEDCKTTEEVQDQVKMDELWADSQQFEQVMLAVRAKLSWAPKTMDVLRMLIPWHMQEG